MMLILTGFTIRSDHVREYMLSEKEALLLFCVLFGLESNWNDVRNWGGYLNIIINLAKAGRPSETLGICLKFHSHSLNGDKCQFARKE